MTTLAAPRSTTETLADLLEQLGGIAPNRVRYPPAPGTATEQDVLDLARREKRMYELVDGALVEKAMGFRESMLAAALCGFLRSITIPQNLGVVTGEQGMMRLFPGLVRMPDAAFVSWDRIPGGRIPEEPIPDLTPDIAIEVLSEGNTPGEMERKRKEYFAARVRLVWMVDPIHRTVTVYTAPDRFTVLGENDVLDGGDVLPGLAIPLRDLFAELDRTKSN
jgi:Uma2 family endonuclease